MKDLGKKRENMESMPDMAIMMGGSEKEKDYPCCYFDTDEDLKLKLGQTCNAKIKVTRVEKKEQEGEDTKYCYEVEIQSVDNKKVQEEDEEDDYDIVQKGVDKAIDDEDKE